MDVRLATPEDADAVCAIYAPIVEQTVSSFETEAPSVQTMRTRIIDTLEHLPWLVALDAQGHVSGYVYASKHRERPAYQWSVDTTAYVREDCRGRGVGKQLYGELFKRLIEAGYFQAFAGIALPNPASVALHEAVGFVTVGIYRDVGFKLGRWCDVGWWQRQLRVPCEPNPIAR